MSSATRPIGDRRTGPLSLVLWATDTAVTYAATAVSVAAIVALFLALGGDVIVRYLTTRSLGWPSEMPNLLFPWLVMGAIVLAAQRGQHVAVTALVTLMRRPLVRLLMLAMQALIAATFFYLAYIGLDVIAITASEVFPVTRLSARYAYLALIFGFIGIGITALTTFGWLLITNDPMAVRAHEPEHDL
jgi:TRAP-type C4-dicarboxylate transport system permease small subunit